MAKELVIKVETLQDYPGAIERVKNAATKGVELGRPFEIALRYPGKKRLQEEKYHAMINDIHQQCFRGFSFDGVKAVLVNQFAIEMEQAGTPLANPGEKIWDWKTQEAVYVRPSTTKFRVGEAVQFIEFLYAAGVDLGVKWSERALKQYDDYKEASP